MCSITLENDLDITREENKKEQINPKRGVSDKEKEEEEDGEGVKEDKRTKETGGEDGKMAPDKQKKWYQRIAGLGLILTFIKVLLKSVGDIIIKKLDNVHPIVLLFYRSVSLVCVCLPLSIGWNKPPFPSDRTLKERMLLVTRGMIGGVAAMATFYSLQHMPLGDQKMIMSSRPIVTIISARIFLKEPIGKLEILATVLMVIGVFLVIQPAFIFSSIAPEPVERDDEYAMSALLLLASTLLTANVTVITRFLRKENFLSVMFSREIQYSALTFIVINIIGIPYFLLERLDQLQVLCMTGVCLLTSMLNIISLKLEQASRITVVDRSSAIMISFLLQIVLFDDIPDAITISGVVFVFLAILLISLNKIFFNQEKKINPSKQQT